MKKNNFFKRRKKDSDRKEALKANETQNLDFYGSGMDEVQEYHNPYLTVTEFFDQKNLESKNLH